MKFKSEVARVELQEARLRIAALETDLAAMTERAEAAEEEVSRGAEALTTERSISTQFEWFSEYVLGVMHVVEANWEYASRSEEAYAAGCEAQGNLDEERVYRAEESIAWHAAYHEAVTLVLGAALREREGMLREALREVYEEGWPSVEETVYPTNDPEHLEAPEYYRAMTPEEFEEDLECRARGGTP